MNPLHNRKIHPVQGIKGTGQWQVYAQEGPPPCAAWDLPPRPATQPGALQPHSAHREALGQPGSGRMEPISLRIPQSSTFPVLPRGSVGRLKHP